MNQETRKKIHTDSKLVLQLYVSGMSEKSMEAIGNINRLCHDLSKNQYDLEIIDLYKQPEKASQQQIVFSPSLIRQLPLPRKTLIGTFSDTRKVMRGLGIRFDEDI